MQRYLDRILECTFDPTQSLKIIALDVLGNIIQQGLAHPVLVRIYYCSLYIQYHIYFHVYELSSVCQQSLR